MSWSSDNPATKLIGAPLKGARQEEALHLQTQPGQHCNAASKQIKAQWSKLEKKQKTQTTKAKHNIQFPNKAITNPSIIPIPGSKHRTNVQPLLG